MIVTLPSLIPIQTWRFEMRGSGRTICERGLARPMPAPSAGTSNSFPARAPEMNLIEPNLMGEVSPSGWIAIVAERSTVRPWSTAAAAGEIGGDAGDGLFDGEGE